MIIRKGNKSVGVYHFPDRKKPHICYSIGNQVYDCGHFNNEDASERFMIALAEMFGIERKDGEQNGNYEGMDS